MYINVMQNNMREFIVQVRYHAIIFRCYAILPDRRRLKENNYAHARVYNLEPV